jgi:hypothetical protein
MLVLRIHADTRVDQIFKEIDQAYFAKPAAVAAALGGGAVVTPEMEE